eukprot:764804-Hanusia_phi.AAC.6
MNPCSVKLIPFLSCPSLSQARSLNGQAQRFRLTFLCLLTALTRTRHLIPSYEQGLILVLITEEHNLPDADMLMYPIAKSGVRRIAQGGGSGAGSFVAAPCPASCFALPLPLSYRTLTFIQSNGPQTNSSQ